MERDADWALTRNAATTTTTDVVVATNVNQGEFPGMLHNNRVTLTVINLLISTHPSTNT